MDFFRPRKDTEPSAPPELILIYLEEVQSTHAPCFAVDTKDCEHPVTLAKIDASGLNIVAETPLVVRRGGPLRLRFYLDNLRFEAKALVVDYSDGDLRLQLPYALALDERRVRPRVLLNQRENARATLFTGLFEGKAVSGFIENVSLGGVRVQLTQALSIKRQTPILLVEDILVVGEVLAAIRLDDLYRCPSLEVPGKVVYLQARMGKLYLGVVCDPGFEERLVTLKDFVTSRTEPIPHALPKKSRAALAVPKPAPPEPARAVVPEKANFAHLQVGSGYRIRFLARGRSFEGLPLVEISAGGCAWRLDRTRAEALAVGTVLDSIFLEYPDLPATELTGRVIQATPTDPGDPEAELLVEAIFTDTEPRIRGLIDQHVLRNLAHRASQRNLTEEAAQQHYPSLVPEAGFTVRFRHRGTAHTAITVAEFSAVGCFLHLPKEDARDLQPGSLLALFKFDHPDLPSIPLQGQVLLVKPMGRHVGLQVVFLNLHERVRASIHVYVLNQIGCQPEAGVAPVRSPLTGADELGRHPRLSVGTDYSCSFRINGVVYQDVALTVILCHRLRVPGRCPALGTLPCRRLHPVLPPLPRPAAAGAHAGLHLPGHRQDPGPDGGVCPHPYGLCQY